MRDNINCSGCAISHEIHIDGPFQRLVDRRLRYLWFDAEAAAQQQPTIRSADKLRISKEQPALIAAKVRQVPECQRKYEESTEVEQRDCFVYNGIELLTRGSVGKT
jgi:hypothetical protein